MISKNELTEEYVHAICKIGQGADCCRYITMGAQGWSCEKHTELARLLDQRVAAGDMHARGDNCDGVASDKPEVQIENWSIGTFGDDPYTAPECRVKTLTGHVTGHPTMGDATIMSSPLVHIDLAQRRVETCNTIYMLGKPTLEYLAYTLIVASEKVLNDLLSGGFVTPAQYRRAMDHI